MSKPVLLIKTGGTIGQKPNEKGALEPSSADYLELWPHLKEIVDVINLGSIDSTNMETNVIYANPTQSEKLVDRSKLARAIYDNAFNYEGFVVVHGTDTMAETAAALTYMMHLQVGSLLPALKIVYPHAQSLSTRAHKHSPRPQFPRTLSSRQLCYES